MNDNLEFSPIPNKAGRIKQIKPLCPIFKTLEVRVVRPGKSAAISAQTKPIVASHVKNISYHQPLLHNTRKSKPDEQRLIKTRLSFDQKRRLQREKQAMDIANDVPMSAYRRHGGAVPSDRNRKFVLLAGSGTIIVLLIIIALVIFSGAPGGA